MEVQVKFADGTIRDTDSVEGILRGGHTLCTPDLDNKLRNLICPKHGSKISHIMIEWKRLNETNLAMAQPGVNLQKPLVIMVVHYSGTCSGTNVCENLEALAEQVLDQDQERGSEFHGPTDF